MINEKAKWMKLMFRVVSYGFILSFRILSSSFMNNQKVVHNSFSQKSELCTLDYIMLHFFFFFLSLAETTVLAFNRTCVWSHNFARSCKYHFFFSVISHWWQICIYTLCFCSVILIVVYYFLCFMYNTFVVVCWWLCSTLDDFTI